MLTKYYIILYITLKSTQLHLTPPKLRFKSESTNIPAPSKVEKGGEDAYFHNSELLVVADGVGFWDTVGIDPGIYSRKLVRNVRDFYFEDKNYFLRNLKNLDYEAGKNDHFKGTSTLVFAVIDDLTGEMKTSNLGDSGFIILRENKNRVFKHKKNRNKHKNYINKEKDFQTHYTKKEKNFQIHYKNREKDYQTNYKYKKKLHNKPYYKYFQSKEQQHSFNFPYQLGSNGDNPYFAKTDAFKIFENDIIILASDGLWDNLFINRVIFEVNRIIEKFGRDLKMISDRLANLAFEHSLDKGYFSPFEKQARKNGKGFKGGKSDDITVVVAQVVRC